jgi:formate dehydrogenase subunit gamma
MTDTIPAATEPGAEVPSRILRFDGTERWLHAANAVLVLFLLVTGSILYIGPLSTLVGRRDLVKDLHVWAGLALVVPVLLAVAGPWRRGLQRDAERLGTWYRSDTTWIRSRGRSSSVRLGKFNAGQKLNALFVAGALPVLLLTGLILKWFEPFPDFVRTGATFVHDWTYVALGLVVIGHIGKALAEPVLLRSMVTGFVPGRWARRYRPAWYDEVVGTDASDHGLQ